MSITTMAQAYTGVQYPVDLIKTAGSSVSASCFYSTFYEIGFPTAASAPSPGMAGASLTTYSGQIPFTNPSAGETELAQLRIGSNGAGMVMLADRLWHNSGIDVTNTGAQTINSSAFPARDVNGSTNGVGVFVAVEVSAACGAATPAVTMTYTNSSGVANRTATNVFATISSAGRGFFFPIGVQAGDEGVRSIQSIQLSASWISGTIHLVAYRILARVPGIAANRVGAVDWVTGGVRMFDNTVPFLLGHPSSAAAVVYSGTLHYTQG